MVLCASCPVGVHSKLQNKSNALAMKRKQNTCIYDVSRIFELISCEFSCQDCRQTILMKYIRLSECCVKECTKVKFDCVTMKKNGNMNEGYRDNEVYVQSRYIVKA